MKSDPVFLIYGRINDEFVMLARKLKASEVTKKAAEIRKTSKCPILILEDLGQPAKERIGRRRENALEAIKNCRIVAKKAAY